MKHFTKEWYQLCQNTEYTLCYKKIPDKVYTDVDIQEFYNKDLKKRIAESRKDHDLQPDYSLQFELLDENDFDPEDWMLIDEDKGVGVFPKSKEEVLERLEAEKKRGEEEFKNREPFDPTAVADDFEQVFKNRCKYVVDEFPRWVTERVDNRLLALDRIPESVFQQLKVEEKQNLKDYNRMTRRAAKAVSAEFTKIPTRIWENFGFHDDRLLHFRKRQKDYEMLICRDGDFCMDGHTPYVRVLFKNATLLEKEKGIVLRLNIVREWYSSNCCLLHEELYRLQDGGYEVHLMAWLNDLKYITLRCEDIQFELNIKYPIEG